MHHLFCNKKESGLKQITWKKIIGHTKLQIPKVWCKYSATVIVSCSVDLLRNPRLYFIQRCITLHLFVYFRVGLLQSFLQIVFFPIHLSQHFCYLKNGPLNLKNYQSLQVVLLAKTKYLYLFWLLLQTLIYSIVTFARCKMNPKHEKPGEEYIS